MTKLTINLSILLILTGILGYFGTGMVSITALIPAFFGLPLLTINLLARKSASPKALILAAIILSGLGLLGSFRGVLILISGSLTAAAFLQSAMCLICAVYIFTAVKDLNRLSKKRTS